MAEEIRADLLIGRDTLSPGLVKAGKAAQDASGNVKDLTKNLYELSKQRATPVVDLNDKDATAKLDDVTAKLKELGARAANPNIDVNDKDAQAKVAQMRVKLDQLSRKVSSPRITLEGLTRAEAGVLRLDVMLDELDRKHAEATVGVSRGGLLSRLGGLFGGGAGGGSALSSLAGFAGPAAIAGGVGLAASLIPALVPFGIGGLVGVGGAGLAAGLGSKANQQILQLVQQRQGITGTTAADKRRRAQLAQQIATIRQANSGPLGVFGALQDLGHSALGVFSGALQAKGPGFSGGGPGGTAGAPSFLTGLTGILKQLGGFIKTLGPQLGELFRASLPFVSAFVKIMEQFAKAVMPALIQAMKEFQPFLPQMIKAFTILAQGLADFIKNLGPGMKPAMTVFIALATAAKGIMIGLAYAADFLAQMFRSVGHDVKLAAEFIRAEWPKVQHDTAAAFDAIRHTIAATWDEIFRNTIGRIERGRHDIANEWDKWRHETASIFDTVRHDIASAWDLIWRNTVGRVKTGISDVVSWFKGLPGKIVHALFGLGHTLGSFAAAALNEMWNGFKRIGSTIVHWIESFAHGIVGIFKKIWGIFSPSSVFAGLGANLMQGLAKGIKSHAHHAVNAASAVGAAVHGNVVSWITAAIRGAGAPMAWLPALERLVSLESGGNPRAVNPISVGGEHATGLWQMLPSTFAGAGGRGGLLGMFNPVIEGIAALNYIRGRYGSPFNIPGLFSGGYRGYATGGMITEPIFGIGRSGRAYGFGERGPEMVIPGGAAGAGTVMIHVHVSADASMHPAETGRIIADRLKAHVKRGGTVFPAGVSPR